MKNFFIFIVLVLLLSLFLSSLPFLSTCISDENISKIKLLEEEAREDFNVFCHDYLFSGLFPFFSLICVFFTSVVLSSFNLKINNRYSVLRQ